MTEATENDRGMKDREEHILKIWERKRESPAKQRLAPEWAAGFDSDIISMLLEL